MFVLCLDAWERETIPGANVDAWERETVPIVVPVLGLRRVYLGIIARGEPVCIYGLCHVLFVIVYEHVCMTDADAALTPIFMLIS